MSLMNDIEENMTVFSKKEKITNVKNEIILMIEKKITLKKQIEILIKNNIIDSIDLKYYRAIIKNFKNKKTECVVKKEAKKEEKKEIKRSEKTATEMLSESFDLKY